MDGSGVNPRYVAYARAHDRTPEAQSEHDRRTWPGGCNTGFMLWIGERWAAYWAAHGMGRWEALSEADHEAFDREIGT